MKVISKTTVIELDGDELKKLRKDLERVNDEIAWSSIPMLSKLDDYLPIAED